MKICSAFFPCARGLEGPGGNTLLFGKALLKPVSVPCRQPLLQPLLALGKEDSLRFWLTPSHSCSIKGAAGWAWGHQCLRDHCWPPKCVLGGPASQQHVVAYYQMVKTKASPRPLGWDISASMTGPPCVPSMKGQDQEESQSSCLGPRNSMAFHDNRKTQVFLFEKKASWFMGGKDTFLIMTQYVTSTQE